MKRCFPLLLILGLGCSDSKTSVLPVDSVKGSSASSSTVKSSLEGVERDLQKAVESAQRKRKVETRKYGAETQDTVIAVEQCFVDAIPRSGPLVGVVHAPYRTAEELRKVAKKSGDSVLFSASPNPGCSRYLAGYWIRDEEAKGDFVVLVFAESGRSDELWWVPDTGTPRPTDLNEVPQRVYVQRLLNVGATLLDEKGDLEGALVLFEGALALDPSSKAVAEGLAELQCELHPPSGVRNLRTFMETYGGGPDLEATLAGCLLEVRTAEAVAEADRTIARILQHHADHLKALSIRAERLLETGEVGEAYALFNRIVQQYPVAYMVHYGAASAALQLGMNPEALEHLDAYIAVETFDLDARFLRAGALITLRNQERALADYRFLMERVADAPEMEELRKRLVRGFGAGVLQ